MIERGHVSLALDGTSAAPTYASVLRHCCWLGLKWITILLSCFMIAPSAKSHPIIPHPDFVPDPQKTQRVQRPGLFSTIHRHPLASGQRDAKDLRRPASAQARNRPGWGERKTFPFSKSQSRANRQLPFARQAASTRDGDIGSSVRRTPIACWIAAPIAAGGGQIGTSPTPRTPNG